jgi:hypothetical protein
MHQARRGDALLVFEGSDDGGVVGLDRPIEHRAIGVVYDPRRDAFGNWVPTVLGRRYDALCWFAETEALHPLHPEVAAHGKELETAPWGT